jgi:transcriptional regulator with XRE-family HTH domain
MQNNDILSMIGENIRMIRKSKGLSQEQLSELSGVHHVYIGSVERGERNISIMHLSKIADALDVELYELLLRNKESDNIINAIALLVSQKNKNEQQMALDILSRIFRTYQ